MQKGMLDEQVVLSLKLGHSAGNLPLDCDAVTGLRSENPFQHKVFQQDKAITIGSNKECVTPTGLPNGANEVKEFCSFSQPGASRRGFFCRFTFSAGIGCISSGVLGW